ncbi:uncharacterized protein LOC105009052 isoform X1 [Esox lucius]|uniref:uncharacterized protein LOC105009052 isoform X1 n=1 Tax=Esox lucius TaxID=8010 RepID=UPI0014777E2C|nr:uncharacterized protein LOC105009052 isoform X1 [Esox lucius]
MMVWSSFAGSRVADLNKVQDSNNQFIRENRLTTPGPKCPTCFTVTQGPALGFNSESSSPYDSCSESDSSSGQPSRVMGSAVMLPQVPVSKDCKLLPTGLETQARQDLGKNIAPDEVPEGRRRPPLNKSHSLPTSLPSSHRVVSSLNVQLFPGNSICPSPCVSYHYSSVRKEDGAEDEKWQCSVQSSLIINKPNSQKRDLPPLPPKPQPSHLTSLPHIMPSSTLVWPVQSHWEQQSTWKAPSLPNKPSNNITYYTPSDNILNNTHMPGYHLTPQQQQQPPHYQKKWQELQKQLQLHKQWETPQLQQQCWQQPQPQLQPYLHPQSAPYAVSDHPPSSAHHQWPISRTANVPHGWVHNELHPEFYTHPDSRLYTNIHSRPQRLPAPLPSCFPHCATCANCSSSYPNSVKPSPGYLRTDRELQLRALHDPSGTAAHDIATVNPSKILSGSAIKKSGPRKFGGLTSRRNYTHKKKVLNEL